MDVRTSEQISDIYVEHAHKLREQFVIVTEDKELYAFMQTKLDKYIVIISQCALYKFCNVNVPMHFIC